MVVIHVKRSEEHQFLYETTVEADVTSTVLDLCEIQNTRLRIQRLKLEGEELAKFGPAKHPEKEGLDEYAEDFGHGKVEKNEHYTSDPTGRRTGNSKFCLVLPTHLLILCCDARFLFLPSFLLSRQPCSFKYVASVEMLK